MLVVLVLAQSHLCVGDDIVQSPLVLLVLPRHLAILRVLGCTLGAVPLGALGLLLKRPLGDTGPDKSYVGIVLAYPSWLGAQP